MEAHPDRTLLATMPRQIAPNTAFLTTTNEDAMNIAYLLEQQGIHATFVQSTSGFSFINLAEVRYFVKQLRRLSSSDTNEACKAIDRDIWKQAKELTCKAYASSRLLPTIRRFWQDFEQVNKTLYFSDLHQYLLESGIDDFIDIGKTAFVSTIHKAKGREFDTVYLLLDKMYGDMNADWLRTIYVGLTRAKRHLHIIGGQTLMGNIIPYPSPSATAALTDNQLFIALGMRDVFLDYFRDRKNIVLRLRSGDALATSSTKTTSMWHNSLWQN